MNFLKSNVCYLFSLHGYHDGHLAGLMEAIPEEIGTICTNRKDVPFMFYNFYSCIFSVGAIVKAL